MIATNIMMNSTPPRTPPMTGARGNLLPPPPEPLCTRPVGEDGAVGEVEESDEGDEIKSEVVVRVSKVVEDWSTKGQEGQHGDKEFGYSRRDQMSNPLSSIFLCATRTTRWVVKVCVQ